MRLIELQHEVLRLASQGVPVGKISAHLRKITKNAGQEPVQTSWVRAWIRNAGLSHRGNGKSRR